MFVNDLMFLLRIPDFVWYLESEVTHFLSELNGIEDDYSEQNFMKKHSSTKNVEE